MKEYLLDTEDGVSPGDGSRLQNDFQKKLHHLTSDAKKSAREAHKQVLLTQKESDFININLMTVVYHILYVK